MRHFLRDDDLTATQQRQLIALASELKSHPYGPTPLAAINDDGKAIPRSVAVMFEKPSTRTRVSFHVGITQLGGNPVIIDAQHSHLTRGETIEDTAAVLSGYVDAIVLRTFTDTRIQTLAAHASVPVINALTENFHPCQLLADLLTMTEEYGDLAGRTIAFIGDTGYNMAHSYALAGALAGAHVRLAGPDQYAPQPDILSAAQRLAKANGGSVSVTADPIAAANSADVIATDTWLSMGQHSSDHHASRFAPYQINAKLVSHAAPHAIVLHCLPAHRGEEITDDVMDGPQSRVFVQSANRLHAQKALLVWLMTGHMTANPTPEGHP